MMRGKVKVGITGKQPPNGHLPNKGRFFGNGEIRTTFKLSDLPVADSPISGHLCCFEIKNNELILTRLYRDGKTQSRPNLPIFRHGTDLDYVRDL